MASGKQLMEQIYDQFLVCKICFEIYKSPKTLSCLHTFCVDCLRKHQDAEYERTYRYSIYNATVTCPICRKRTDLPTGGVRRLPDNFLVANLSDVVTRRRPFAKSQECEICKSDSSQIHRQAVSKCLDCAKLLCKICVELHRKTKVTKSHSLFDIEIEKEIECKNHPDEIVRFYCEPCEQCICVVCTFQEHKGHDVSSFSEGMQKYQESLDKLVSLCRERIHHVKEQITTISHCENEIKGAEDQIRDMAIDSITDIRKKEREMVECVYDVYGPEAIAFLKEKQPLQENLETLQNTCNLTDVVTQDKNVELLLLKNEIEDKINKLLEKEVNAPPESLKKQVKFIPGSIHFGQLSVNDEQSISNLNDSLPAIQISVSTDNMDSQTDCVSFADQQTATEPPPMCEFLQHKLTQTHNVPREERSSRTVTSCESSNIICEPFTQVPSQANLSLSDTSNSETKMNKQSNIRTVRDENKKNSAFQQDETSDKTTKPESDIMKTQKKVTQSDVTTDTLGLVVLQDQSCITPLCYIKTTNSNTMTDTVPFSNTATETDTIVSKDTSSNTTNVKFVNKHSSTKKIKMKNTGVNVKVEYQDKEIGTADLVKMIHSGFGENDVRVCDQSVETPWSVAIVDAHEPHVQPTNISKTVDKCSLPSICSKDLQNDIQPIIVSKTVDSCSSLNIDDNNLQISLDDAVDILSDNTTIAKAEADLSHTSHGRSETHQRTFDDNTTQTEIALHTMEKLWQLLDVKMCSTSVNTDSNVVIKEKVATSNQGCMTDKILEEAKKTFTTQNGSTSMGSNVLEANLNAPELVGRNTVYHYDSLNVPKNLATSSDTVTGISGISGTVKQERLDHATPHAGTEHSGSLPDIVSSQSKIKLVDACTTTNHFVSYVEQECNTVTKELSEKSCGTVPREMKDKKTATFIERRNVAIMKRPHYISRGIVTSKIPTSEKTTETAAEHTANTASSMKTVTLCDTSCDPIQIPTVASSTSTEQKHYTDSCTAPDRPSFANRQCSPVRLPCSVDRGNSPHKVECHSKSVSVSPSCQERSVETMAAPTRDSFTMMPVVKYSNRKSSPIRAFKSVVNQSTSVGHSTYTTRALSPIRGLGRAKGTMTSNIGMKNRASSPVHIPGNDKGVSVQPEMSTIGTRTKPTLTSDACISTLKISSIAKGVETERKHFSEKQTLTTRIHTINKMIGTENTKLVDGFTSMATDIASAYKDVIAPKPVPTCSRGTSTYIVELATKETSPHKPFSVDRGSSPVNYPAVDRASSPVNLAAEKGGFLSKSQIIEPQETYQSVGMISLPFRPVADNPKSALSSIQELTESDDDYGSSGKQVISKPPFGRRAISAADIRTPPKGNQFCNISFAENIPKQGHGSSSKSRTSHKNLKSKETCTTAVETEDKCVCTESLQLGNEKMAACISKLKTVRQRLEHQPVYVQAPAQKGPGLKQSVESVSSSSGELSHLEKIKKEYPAEYPKAFLLDKLKSDVDLQLRSKSVERDQSSEEPKSYPPFLTPQTPRKLRHAESSEDTDDSQGKRALLARKKKPPITELLGRSASLPEQDPPMSPHSHKSRSTATKPRNMSKKLSQSEASLKTTHKSDSKKKSSRPVKIEALVAANKGVHTSSESPIGNVSHTPKKCNNPKQKLNDKSKQQPPPPTPPHQLQQSATASKAASSTSVSTENPPPVKLKVRRGMGRALLRTSALKENAGTSSESLSSN